MPQLTEDEIRMMIDVLEARIEWLREDLQIDESETSIPKYQELIAKLRG